MKPWTRTGFDPISLTGGAQPEIYWGLAPRNGAIAAITVPEVAPASSAILRHRERVARKSASRGPIVHGGQSLLRLRDLPGGRLTEVRVLLEWGTPRAAAGRERKMVPPLLRVVSWSDAAPEAVSQETSLDASSGGEPIETILVVGSGEGERPRGVALNHGINYGVHLVHPFAFGGDGVNAIVYSVRAIGFEGA